MNKNICALLSFALVVALLPACRDKNEDYRMNDGRTKNKMYERNERKNGKKRQEKKTEREYRDMSGNKVREKNERTVIDEDVDNM